MYKKLKTWRGNKNTQIAHVSLLSILFEKSLVFEKWLEYVQKKLFLVARYHIAEKQGGEHQKSVRQSVSD